MKYLATFLTLILMNYPIPVMGSALSSNPISIIAHRGASCCAPEHTFASYELAKIQGANYIELDVGMTKDGKLVAIHDKTIDRTTNGKGRVQSFSLSQIQQFDAGSWFNNQYPERAKSSYTGQRIPSLEEVIKTFGHSVNYYIEIKTPENYQGITEVLLKILKSYHLIGGKAGKGKVIIESFRSSELKRIHQKYPKLFLIQLINDSSKINLAEVAAYAEGVGPNYLKINKDFVKHAHEKGLVVHCWTVNSESNIKKLVGWGVDGIFTNYVDLAKQVATGKVTMD